MKLTLHAILLLTALLAATSSAASAAESKMLPVLERNHTTCVSATELERGAGIAIKRLPGSDAVVACSGDRCALVKAPFREGDVTWVSVTALADALGFTARFSAERRQVRLEARPKRSSPGDAVAGVGGLALNFRVTRHDGSPVSLADFRGKRVLIQSWASW